mmetsp:Transcript_71438/g.220855  ORF Transcript_71438/g.220855 Transcript_71438/m.220855 type:complete len:183 (+) Transcript_71438:83-631(+)
MEEPAVNHVARNRVHQEHCRKEMKSQVLRTQFMLVPGSKSSAGAVSGKVNERDPALPARGSGSCLEATGGLVLATPRGAAATGASSSGAVTAKGAAAAKDETLENFLQVLDRPRRRPMDKYEEPQTSSMAIGWDAETRKNEELSQREQKFQARWSRPRKNAEMSDFCERYVDMYGTSPFAVQ